MLKIAVVALTLVSISVQASDWREPQKAELAKMKNAAEIALKDADSAKYKGLKASPSLDGKSIVICGFFNSKNSYGGYSGYEPFLYSTSDDTFMVANDGGSRVVIDAICNS